MIDLVRYFLQIVGLVVVLATIAGAALEGIEAYHRWRARPSRDETFRTEFPELFNRERWQ